MKVEKEKIGEKIGNIAEKAKQGGDNITKKTKNLAVKSKEKVVTVLDSNGDGTIDINDIIILSLKTPGIRIDREKF